MILWFRLLFVSCAFSLMLSPLLAENLPFLNSHLTRVDGVKIHYRYWGVDNGAPLGSVLLVHGFGASTFSWQEVADSLNALGFEVVAVDVPPFGYSDKDRRVNQSVTAQAQRLHSLINRSFPGRQWHVAGHSMGGSVVQALALMHPKDMASVTFVSAVIFSATSSTNYPARNLLRLSPLHFIAGEMAQTWVISPSRVETLLESAYGQEPTEEQMRGYLLPLSIPGTATAILSSATFHREVADLDAARLQVPALAIWGDQDNWVPLQGRRRNLERMPGVELQLMEGVGHNPMETHFEEFMDRWLPFLRNTCNRSL